MLYYMGASIAKKKKVCGGGWGWVCVWVLKVEVICLISVIIIVR